MLYLYGIVGPVTGRYRGGPWAPDMLGGATEKRWAGVGLSGLGGSSQRARGLPLELSQPLGVPQRSGSRGLLGLQFSFQDSCGALQNVDDVQAIVRRRLLNPARKIARADVLQTAERRGSSGELGDWSRREGLLSSRLGDLSHCLDLIFVRVGRDLEESRLIVAYASLEGRLFR